MEPKSFTKRTMAKSPGRLLDFPYIALLKICAEKRDLSKGVRLHSDILKWGVHESDPYVASALVSMYMRCSAVESAQQVLDELPARDIVCWNALITGYAQHEEIEKVITCFTLMQLDGHSPDAVTFTSILNVCGSARAAHYGKQIHHEVACQRLLEESVAIGNALLDMYAKCGALMEAQEVFQKLCYQDIISWSALMTGYVQQGEAEKAFICYEQILNAGLFPNEVTYICILKAVGNIRVVDKGKQVHVMIINQHLLDKDTMLGFSLVEMYTKCGLLSHAECVFDKLPIRNVVCWSALMTGYIENGQIEEVLNCYEQMQHEGLSPSGIIFNCVLRACGRKGAVDKGKQIHDEIVCQGLLRKNIVLGNALVDMYTKCGSLVKAQQVLEELRVQDAITWSTLIKGYIQHGHAREALKCFERMQTEGLYPDANIFACILMAYGSIGAAVNSKQIHDEIVKQDLFRNDIILGTNLVHMYANCDAVVMSQQAFDELHVRDIICWNALIAGYVQQEMGEEALGCAERMQCEGLSPDAVTFICILKACGNMGSAGKGRQIHREIVSKGLMGTDATVVNALVGMYAKCGLLAEAYQVLEGIPVRTVVCWSVLIAGYAQEVNGKVALDCFKQMCEEGLIPDSVTFLSVLNACSRSGLLDEGQFYMTNMFKDFGIRPNIEHHTCLIDFYSRVGYLKKASSMINCLPCAADPSLWSALLSACQKLGNLKLGIWAFDSARQGHKDSGMCAN